MRYFRTLLAILTLLSTFSFGQGTQFDRINARGAITTPDLITSSTLFGKRIENCRWVDGQLPSQWAGADFGAQVNSALADAGVNGSVCVAPGSYTYPTDIVMTTPGTLVCIAKRTCILNYTGTGKGLKVGADGLVASSTDPYVVDGFEFTNGASANQVLYINSFVTHPLIINNYFKNAGNAATSETGYAIYAQSNNWVTAVTLNRFEDTDGVARNKVRVRGKSVGGVSDNGNSQLFFSNNEMANPSNSGGSAAAGIGVWFTGTGSVLSDNKIEGFAPNVRVAPAAQGSSISHNYFEDVNNTCNIEFGDPAGGDSPLNFVLNLEVTDSPNVNMHNTDSFATTANFICPTSGNTNTGLQNARIRDNVLSSVGSTIPMVALNNVASQINNESSGNTGQTLEHTTGASINAWRSFINGQYANGVDDSSNGNYLDLKEGSTANNSKGIAARGFNNALQGLCDWDLNGVFRCLAGTSLNNVIRGDTNGNVTISKAGQTTTFPGPIVIASTLVSPTAPTIAAAGCGGAAASIVVSNGTAAFKVNVGTTPTSACTITMPIATTGWNCSATDITTNSTSVFLQKQTGAESTTSVVITNFSDVAVATAFVASDILKVQCFAD